MYLGSLDEIPKVHLPYTIHFDLCLKLNRLLWKIVLHHFYKIDTINHFINHPNPNVGMFII